MAINTFSIIREGVLSAIHTPVATIVTSLLVAGMVTSVLLTSGMAEGLKEEVLSTIDSGGTRSIVISAPLDAGLDSTVLNTLSRLEGIEMSIAFGSAVDARNYLLPDGNLVPLRDYWEDSVDEGSLDYVVASTIALQRLGMEHAAGKVVTTDGEIFYIKERLRNSDSIAIFEPLLLIPRSHEDPGSVSTIFVLAAEASKVRPLTAAIKTLLVSEQPELIRIDSSESLAILRGEITGQLNENRFSVALGATLVAGLLVALVQGCFVLLKRRDYGRRRALGAPRRLIVLLLLIQTGSAGAAGAVLGVVISLTSLSIMQNPMPGFTYYMAVAVLATCTSLIAALLPAIFASNREPIRELRLP